MTGIPERLALKIEKKQANCPVHGPFESRCILGTIWTKCPACTAEEDQRDAAKRAQAEQERRQRILADKIGRACLPERFASQGLDAYEVEHEGQARALKFARDYSKDFSHVRKTGRSALFVGGLGTGKTHLSVGIALEVMRQGYTALFLTVFQAIRTVKDSWRGGSEARAIAALVEPDLLILDELGQQFGSDTEQLILFDVLNERYSQRKPVILLSNHPIAEIEKLLGSRMMDRLREDGAECVIFKWPSHRLTHKNN